MNQGTGGVLKAKQSSHFIGVFSGFRLLLVLGSYIYEIKMY